MVCSNTRTLPLGSLSDLNDQAVIANDTASDSKQLLYELYSEIAQINKNLTIVIKHLSLLTDTEIEG